MATQPNSEELWTVQEYLRTSWRPDREFVDGRIEERNVGEKEHSIVQRFLTFLFMLKRSEWGVEVFPELRTQTKMRNFRVPDVLVMPAGVQFERYVTTPPLIAVEILSPEDSLSAMQQKGLEYRQFGVQNVWIVDPYARIAHCLGASGFEELRSGELSVPGSSIRVDLSEMFAELDR